jgi:hypothetical protein
MESDPNFWTYSFGPWIEWLATSGSNVFVAGGFAGPGGDTSPIGIARFSTSGGSIPIENLMSGGGDGFGRAVTIQNSVTYVAGTFDAVGGTSANGIAQWSSGVWSPLESGLTDGNGNPATGTGLASDGNAVYVAGNFAAAGGISAQGVARWVTGSNPDPISSCNVNLVNPTFSGCSFSFTVTGQAGSRWWISYSTDLINWQVISDMTLWSGSAPFTDTTACADPHRYYRATNLCCDGTSSMTAFSRPPYPD